MQPLRPGLSAFRDEPKVMDEKPELGHSLQTLMTTYRHILDKRKDRAADVARTIFGGSNGT
jgi:hypothetical protein